MAGFRGHVENPGYSHPKILKFITSAKTFQLRSHSQVTGIRTSTHLSEGHHSTHQKARNQGQLRCLSQRPGGTNAGTPAAVGRAEGTDPRNKAPEGTTGKGEQ